MTVPQGFLKYESPKAFAGTLVSALPVEGKSLTYSKRFKWQRNGLSHWKLKVQIRTDEGWLLCGFIGLCRDRRDLPRIALGQRIETEPLNVCGTSHPLYGLAAQNGFWWVSNRERVIKGRAIRPSSQTDSAGRQGSAA